MSMGYGLGIPLIAVELRIRAAVWACCSAATMTSGPNDLVVHAAWRDM